MLSNYYGLPIFETELIPKKRVQTRFPRSKKRRIKEKWAKKYYKLVDQAVLTGNGCYVSKLMANEMSKYMNDITHHAIGCLGTASYSEKSDVLTLETLKNAVELLKQNDTQYKPIKWFDYSVMDWING